MAKTEFSQEVDLAIREIGVCLTQDRYRDAVEVIKRFWAGSGLVKSRTPKEWLLLRFSDVQTLAPNIVALCERNGYDNIGEFARVFADKPPVWANMGAVRLRQLMECLREIGVVVNWEL